MAVAAVEMAGGFDWEAAVRDAGAVVGRTATSLREVAAVMDEESVSPLGGAVAGVAWVVEEGKEAREAVEAWREERVAETAQQVARWGTQGSPLCVPRGLPWRRSRLPRSSEATMAGAAPTALWPCGLVDERSRSRRRGRRVVEWRRNLCDTSLQARVAEVANTSEREREEA